MGQYYIWEFGFTIQNQRDDFWGWEACNLEGWKRGAGYGSIVPNGAGSQVASNQIYPNQNISWGSDTYSGVPDYYINLSGRAYTYLKYTFNEPKDHINIGIEYHYIFAD